MQVKLPSEICFTFYNFNNCTDVKSRTTVNNSNNVTIYMSCIFHLCVCACGCACFIVWVSHLVSVSRTLSLKLHEVMDNFTSFLWLWIWPLKICYTQKNAGVTQLTVRQNVSVFLFFTLYITLYSYVCIKKMYISKSNPLVASLSCYLVFLLLFISHRFNQDHYRNIRIKTNKTFLSFPLDNVHTFCYMYVIVFNWCTHGQCWPIKCHQQKLKKATWHSQSDCDSGWVTVTPCDQHLWEKAFFCCRI